MNMVEARPRIGVAKKKKVGKLGIPMKGKKKKGGMSEEEAER